MGLALHELGLDDRFDAIYGSSAGALNGLWLMSGRAKDGVPTWTDADLGKVVMDKRRIFGSRPIVDMQNVIENHYERISPACSRRRSNAGPNSIPWPPTSKPDRRLTFTARSPTGNR